MVSLSQCVSMKWKVANVAAISNKVNARSNVAMIARKKVAAIAKRTKRVAKVNAEIAANVAAISNKVNARSNVVMTARKKAAVRKNAATNAK